jgi:hypothetical protein
MPQGVPVRLRLWVQKLAEKRAFFCFKSLDPKVELASNTNTARHSGLRTGGMFDPAFAGRQVRLWVRKLAEKRAFFV